MTDVRWLSIRNFPAYQHYKDRDPVWIKWHHDALADKKLRSLSPAGHHLWPYLLLMAARYENAITLNPRAIAVETGVPQRSVTDGLRELLKIRLVIETKTPRRISLDASRRASKKTGWKYVRGSHGGTYVRHPDGADRPPRAFIDSMRKVSK